MLEKIKAVGRGLRDELEVLRLVVGDPRTPWTAKTLLWLAIGYTMMPFDVIPDFIPVIGHLDDLVIVPVLVIVALRLIPADVVEESRCRVAKRGGMKKQKARALLIDLTEYWTVEKCRGCECLQGALTQLGSDFPEMGEDVGRLSTSRTHECLGCEPCPPANAWAEYLKD